MGIEEHLNLFNFAGWDTNKDGQISANEALNGPLPANDALQDNGDINAAIFLADLLTTGCSTIEPNAPSMLAPQTPDALDVDKVAALAALRYAGDIEHENKEGFKATLKEAKSDAINLIETWQSEQRELLPKGIELPTRADECEYLAIRIDELEQLTAPSYTRNSQNYTKRWQELKRQIIVLLPRILQLFAFEHAQRAA